jgi:hypothetical protein
MNRQQTLRRKSLIGKYLNLISQVILLGIFSLSTGCVSVNIGAKAGVKSQGVSFAEPTAPFEKMDKSRADGAWQNKNNGSTISYFSTCNDPSDPPLDSVSTELFSDLNNFHIVRQEPTRFNGREALDSEVEGTVEGVNTRIRSMVFKKNGCLYSLTLVGLGKQFEEDRPRFSEFLKGFRAP